MRLNFAPVGVCNFPPLSGKKWLRWNILEPSYHERKRGLCTQCFVKVCLCLRSRSVPSTYVCWVRGLIISLALNGTHRERSRRAIDAETEGPSAGEAAVKRSPSHAVRLHRLPSQRSVLKRRRSSRFILARSRCTAAARVSERSGKGERRSLRTGN